MTQSRALPISLTQVTSSLGGIQVKTYSVTFALCLLLALAAAYAQTPAPDAALSANPAYKKNCAKCHGKTAEGRHFGGPSLVTGKVAEATADDLRNIISNGIGRMPKYAGKLTPEEIDLIVQQIKAAK